MHVLIRSLFSAVLVLGTFIVQTTSAQISEERRSDRPANVIFFIADGCGPASYTMAREYLRYNGNDRGLAIDPWVVGSASTYSSDSRVTDSGAAATALASGVKTYNTAIGVDSLRQPTLTLMEAAIEAGMAAGLVVTTRITHATPAAFSAHVVSRNMEDEIAAQQLRQGIHVILGGGRRHFQPVAAGGVREDELDLLEEARSAGYRTIARRDELIGVTNFPVLGLFAMDQMAYEIDRDSLAEPSLAEMTEKAIELLREGERGFFLMVEGSRIDHAGHGNDAAAHLHDVLAFDDAVRAAVEFAEQDGQTLVVGVSDHETGGLTLGSGRGGTYDWRPDVLGRVTSSHDAMINMIIRDARDAEAVVLEHAGISGLDETERLLLDISSRNRSSSEIASAIGRIIAARAMIGWTTDKHTAVDVPVFAFGPGREHFIGHQDNAEIGLAIARLLNFDLPRRHASN